MSLRPITPISDTDPLPDLTHGVPGVQWNDDDDAPGRSRPAQLRHANMPADDQESYVLYLALIFGIALVLRLLVVMMGPGFAIDQAYTATTEHQIALAENLAEHQAFGVESQPAGSLAADLDQLRADRGEQTSVGDTGLTPEVYQAPGYPAVLSLFTLTGLPLVWLLVIQCVLGALCVPLVYRVGLGVIGRKMPSTLAAVVVALHPAMIFAPAALGADVIVAILVLAGLFGIAQADKRGFRSVLGGGIALGGAALFAPMTAWLAPVAAVWLVLTQRRLPALGLAVVLMFGAALPMGGWAYRNIQHGAGPILTAQPAMDQVFGTLAAIRNPAAGPYTASTREKLWPSFVSYSRQEAVRDQPTLVLLGRYGREQLSLDRGEHLRLLGESAKVFALDHSLDEAYARLGIDYIPAGYAAQVLGEDLAANTPEEPVTEWIINSWVGLNAVTVAAMAVGAVLMLWRRRAAGLLLLVGVCGVFVYASTAGPSESLRLPIIGLQALMVTAILAPGPLRVKKPKARKLRKMKKLEDEAVRVTGSPLATEASLRPAQAPPTAGQVEAAPPAEPSGSLQHAVHPALTATPPPPPTPEEEAQDFANQVADERAKNLAMSGRPI
ncbi:MAG: hypothetical protein AAGG38_03620 [Planctomycetota bacterium]